METGGGGAGCCSQWGSCLPQLWLWPTPWDLGREGGRAGVGLRVHIVVCWPLNAQPRPPRPSAQPGIVGKGAEFGVESFPVVLAGPACARTNVPWPVAGRQLSVLTPALRRLLGCAHGSRWGRGLERESCPWPGLSHCCPMLGISSPGGAGSPDARRAPGPDAAEGCLRLAPPANPWFHLPLVHPLAHQLSCMHAHVSASWACYSHLCHVGQNSIGSAWPDPPTPPAEPGARGLPGFHCHPGKSDTRPAASTLCLCSRSGEMSAPALSCHRRPEPDWARPLAKGARPCHPTRSRPRLLLPAWARCSPHGVCTAKGGAAGPRASVPPRACSAICPRAHPHVLGLCLSPCTGGWSPGGAAPGSSPRVPPEQEPSPGGDPVPWVGSSPPAPAPSSPGRSGPALALGQARVPRSRLLGAGLRCH